MYLLLLGFPILDENLRWGNEGNVFIMGGYAGLELGPQAGNLFGAMVGALKIIEGLGL